MGLASARKENRNDDCERPTPSGIHALSVRHALRRPPETSRDYRRERLQRTAPKARPRPRARPAHGHGLGRSPLAVTDSGVARSQSPTRAKPARSHRLGRSPLAASLAPQARRPPPRSPPRLCPAKVARHRPASFCKSGCAAAAPVNEKSPEVSFGAFGCAGAQLDFPAQQFQGVAEVWVPFEEAIVIGWR
jgi:hypothetical protein